MEAVKWNLNVVDKITIYTDSREIVYKRENDKWHGNSVLIRSVTMLKLLDSYQRAGCIVIPETSIYIPTDTYAIEVGTWEIDEDNGRWGFDRGSLFVKCKEGWRWRVSTLTDVGIIGTLRRRLNDNKVIKYLNSNLDCIGYMD